MGTTTLQSKSSTAEQQRRPQRVVKAATAWPNFVVKIGDAKPRWGHPTPPSAMNVLADPPGMRHSDILAEIQRELDEGPHWRSGCDWQCMDCLRKRMYRTSKAQKPRVCPWCDSHNVSRRKPKLRKVVKQIQATKN